MRRMNLVCGSWGESLLKDLNSMRKAKERCDVKLILQGGTVDLAHSSVLAAASPFFKSILEGTDNPELNMEDFPKDIIKQVLCFMYTGSVDVDMSDLFMLHTVAVDLNIQILQDMVEQVMHTLPRYNGESEEQENNTTVVKMKEEESNDNEDVPNEDWPDTPRTTNSMPSPRRSIRKLSPTKKAQESSTPKARPRRSSSIKLSDKSNITVVKPQDVDNNDDVDDDNDNGGDIEMLDYSMENDTESEDTPDQEKTATSITKKQSNVMNRSRIKKAKVKSHSVIIKESTVPGISAGVFTISLFPQSVAFGPYPKITEKDNSNTPNWLRYINFAPIEEQQNVEAYDYKGYTFFRTCRDVNADTELLLWCTEDERERLGIGEPNDDGFEVFGFSPIYLPSGKMFDPPEERYDCVDCGLAYVSEMAYYKHMRRKHDQPIPVDIYKQIEEEKQRVLSSQADASIKQESANAALILQSIMPQRRRSRRGENNQGLHKCPVCHKTFKQPSTLTQHVAVHSDERPHTCQHCGRGFKQLGNLTTHLKVHTGEKPFKCDKCGKGFTEQSNFRRHWRIHTGEKPYLCVTCGRGFTQFTHLETHTRLHTGEKPFKCTLCPKAFREKSSLAIHMKRHGEKTYLCPVCNKTFYTGSELRNHKIANHTDEKDPKMVKLESN